jgi:hypothetical protein
MRRCPGGGAGPREPEVAQVHAEKGLPSAPGHVDQTLWGQSAGYIPAFPRHQVDSAITNPKKIQILTSRILTPGR